MGEKNNKEVKQLVAFKAGEGQSIKPFAFIGLKCPHCGKEIGMAVYKHRL